MLRRFRKSHRNNRRRSCISEPLESRLLLTTYTPSAAFTYSVPVVVQALVMSSSSTFTGVTSSKIFQASGSGSAPTSVATFSTGGDNPYHPVGTLAQDSAGDLFGVTENGGNDGTGGIYEFTGGSIHLLASFNMSTTGALAAGLFMDPRGDFYGSTETGGAYDGGTIWEWSPSSQSFTTIVPLTSDIGLDNYGVVADAAGDIFGATNSGTFFEVQAGATTLTSLAQFGSTASGIGGLTIDSSGNVYGVEGLEAQSEIYEDAAANRSQLRNLGMVPSGAWIVRDSAGDLFTSGVSGPGQDSIYEVLRGQTSAQSIATLTAAVEGNDVFTLALDASTGVLYGNTDDGGADGDGAIFELTPNIAPPTGGTLTPALTAALPTASLVAGQKANFTQKLTLDDTGTSPVSGPVSAIFFLSSDGSIDSSSIALPLTAARTIHLNPGKSTAVLLHFRSIPAGTPAGMYHIIAQVTGPSGVADAVSASNVTVVPPIIDLTGTFVAASKTVRNGRNLSLTFALANTGNIPATGSLPVQIDLSTLDLDDESIDLAPIATKINLKPAREMKITVHGKISSVTDGVYFVFVKLDTDNTLLNINPAGYNFSSTSAVLTVTG